METELATTFLVLIILFLVVATCVYVRRHGTRTFEFPASSSRDALAIGAVGCILFTIIGASFACHVVHSGRAPADRALCFLTVMVGYAILQVVYALADGDDRKVIVLASVVGSACLHMFGTFVASVALPGFVTVLVAMASAWAVFGDTLFYPWCRYADDAVNPRKRIHYVCGLVHLLSGTAIFGSGYVATKGDPAQFQLAINADVTAIDRWTYTCYNAMTNSDDNTGAQDCDSALRRYSRTPPDTTAFTVNLLYMAAAFAGWSGLLHMVGAASDLSDNIVRFVDYAVSAPIMIALANALWGAANVGGVAIGPATLCAALLVSCAVVYTVDHAPLPAASRPTTSTLRVVVACLIGAYTLAVCVPLLHAAHVITKPSAVGADDAAPGIVMMVAITIVVLFTLFIRPFWSQVFHPQDDGKEPTAVFLRYTFLSLVSKTILHATLGLLVLSQTAMLTHDRAKPPPDPNAQVGPFVGTTSSVVVAGYVAYRLVHEWLEA